MSQIVWTDEVKPAAEEPKSAAPVTEQTPTEKPSATETTPQSPSAATEETKPAEAAKPEEATKPVDTAKPTPPSETVPASQSSRTVPPLPTPSTVTTPSPTTKSPPVSLSHSKGPVVAAPIEAKPELIKESKSTLKIDETKIDETESTTIAPGQLPPNEKATLLGTPHRLTPELVALKKKVTDTIAVYEKRLQNTRDNTAWEVMHAFVAFGAKTEIRRGGDEGVPVNAIGWILWGGRCHGQQLLYLNNGRPHVDVGVGIQGHPAQMLAILAQSRVSAKTEIDIQGKQFLLQDLIDEEMLDCDTNMELTFKLISFSYYMDLDKTWKSRDGQTWSIPRLINEELKAPIRGAACGGNHRLFGLTSAWKQRQKTQPLDGEYKRAYDYIQAYLRYAYSLQNQDGSFSTDWFNNPRPGNKPDVDRKIQTSGHFSEWMILAQDREQLTSPKMIKAIDFITTSLANEPQREWKLGPLGHALHSLVMYNDRVFPEPRVDNVARREVIDQKVPDPTTELKDPVSEQKTEPKPSRGDQGQEDEHPKRIHIEQPETELKIEVK